MLLQANTVRLHNKPLSLSSMEFHIKPQAKKPAALRPSLFSDPDPDDSSPAVDIRKEALRCANQVQAASYQLLAEDPTALAYDSVYDSFKAAKAKPNVSSQPQYIPAMRQAAIFKSKEQRIYRENAESRDRRKEEKETGVTERIYTESYRKMMEENRKLEEELEVQDREKLKHTVEAQGGSRVFFANLLEHITGGAPAPAKRPKIEVPLEKPPTPVAEKVIEVEEPVAETPLPPALVKNTEETLQSARARYLQRKQQSLASSQS